LSRRSDSRFPEGFPVTGDVEHRLHEDLEVNKNSAMEIFADVIVVIGVLVSLVSVRVAFLLLTNG